MILGQFKRMHPNIILIGSFALTILFGSLLLHATFSVKQGTLSLVDAFFTATSAVCVTGLTVVDTGTRFTTAGQIILLLLIQMGGLGIMTYTTVVILLLGKRLSVKGRDLVQGTLSHHQGEGVSTLIRNVFLMTLLFEGTGMILLFVRWLKYFPPRQALFEALFHSVSAFCNAGFSLFSDSLSRFRADPWINGVILLLIITGGIGFLVLQELYRYTITRIRWKEHRRISIHSQTVLGTTALLVVIGALGFLLLEWRNVLAHASFGEKWLISFFQSVTPRTAGFNTVDYHLLTNGTLLFTILLMIIGASPGSTGGGIKTTSFAVLMAMAVSKWKARSDTVLFRRTIPTEIVARTISIIFLSLLLILLGTMALMVTELGGIPHPQSRGLFLEYLFEAVSAFGTVGLSTGVTHILTSSGKVILMILMFVGRLGPITVALAISGRGKEELFSYPEEDIMVG
jgi:trk system potassium uptake protein TrkH